jgi:predicted membrane-bound dolichyl-phosphate-mannose-protein mannosyltransferase
VAVGFLALVFALATVSGVILLLQRRALGRYLIVAGAVVALLAYVGVFIAGARVAWIVYTLPLLPVASVVLALHPHTKRWLPED